MNIATQSIIVGIILVGVVLYLIYKIVKWVKRRNEPDSPCCGCEISCSLKEINMAKREKSIEKCCKVEK